MAKTEAPDNVEHSFQEEMELEVQACERKALETGNPLYAWLALGALWAAHLDRSGEAQPVTTPLLVPAWCAEVLSDAATSINVLLSNGSDVDLVPRAMGFTRQGYNAFKDFRSQVLDVRVAARFDELRAQGKSFTTAMDILTKERNRDRSVLLKRVTRRRKAN